MIFFVFAKQQVFLQSTQITSVFSFREQISIFESAKSEIASKLLQRRIALERCSSSKCFNKPSETVGAKGITQRDISNQKGRVESLVKMRNIVSDRVGRKRRLLHVARSLERPNILTILRSSNKQVSVFSDEQLNVTTQIHIARDALLRELSALYPIENQLKWRTIRDVSLPPMGSLRRIERRDEGSIATAIGHMVHRTTLASKILDRPLRSLLIPAGSRSLIKDKFSNPTYRELPIFVKDGDRLKNVEAIEMLHACLTQFAFSRSYELKHSNDFLELAEIAESNDLDRVSK